MAGTVIRSQRKRCVNGHSTGTLYGFLAIFRTSYMHPPVIACYPRRQLKSQELLVEGESFYLVEHESLVVNPFMDPVRIQMPHSGSSSPAQLSSACLVLSNRAVRWVRLPSKSYSKLARAVLLRIRCYLCCNRGSHGASAERTRRSSTLDWYNSRRMNFELAVLQRR